MTSSLPWRLCRRSVKPCDGAAAPLGVSLRSSLSLPLALPVGGVRGPPLVDDMACWGGGMMKGPRSGALFYAVWLMDTYKNVPQPQGHIYACTLYGSNRIEPGRAL